VIRPINELVAVTERDELDRARRQLQQVLAPLFSGALERQLPETMPDEDLINALAQYLEFEPVEKLALLERDGPLARCRSMLELLEIKQMGSGKKDPGSGLIH
jgi:hypothetical protein